MRILGSSSYSSLCKRIGSGDGGSCSVEEDGREVSVCLRSEAEG